MAFTIQYLSDGQEVDETQWECDVPPSTKHARRGIKLRAADTAIIRDERGKHLVAIKEKVRYIPKGLRDNGKGGTVNA